MTEDEQVAAKNAFAVPMGRWRLWFLALILLMVALPLAESIHDSPPVWAIVLEACVLIGCALAGWLLIVYAERWPRKVSELAVALWLLAPAVVLAVVLPYVLRVEYAGEAVILYLGFALLRGTRPDRLRLLPATSKEWIQAALVLLFAVLMAALYWHMEAIFQWLIKRYLLGSLKGD